MVYQTNELLACDLLHRIPVCLVDAFLDILISECVPGVGKRLGDNVLEKHITCKLVIVQAKLVPVLLELLEMLWDVGKFHSPELEDSLEFVCINKPI